MKRIQLEDIETTYRIKEYTKLYQKVRSMIEEGKIKPVKSRGTNGKTPALYKEYWILENQKDYSDLTEELYYKISSVISTDYYLHHIEQYEEDRQWVLLLSDYLKNKKEELQIPVSMNERSFAIWHREKFLKEEQGKRILKRCGMSMEQLNFYETTEPLACYVHTREIPQNLLIIENKDTFYSMRRALLSGQDRILGMKVGTLIYGAGKGILRSFQDFSLCAEPYMRAEDNAIYYFGDMDYEGILIYENLAQLCKDSYEIMPFTEAYLKMLEKAGTLGMEQLPFTKEGQNHHIGTLFWDYFDQSRVKEMEQLLEQNRYIPQEILSVQEL